MDDNKINWIPKDQFLKKFRNIRSSLSNNQDENGKEIYLFTIDKMLDELFYRSVVMENDLSRAPTYDDIIHLNKDQLLEMIPEQHREAVYKMPNFIALLNYYDNEEDPYAMFDLFNIDHSLSNRLYFSFARERPEYIVLLLADIEELDKPEERPDELEL